MRRTGRHDIRGLRINRRTVLTLSLVAPLARALGRHPLGGVLRIELPLSMTRIDPHSSSDPMSAWLTSAIADPLFAWDSSRKAYPALAARMPEPDPRGARIELRPGLVTARGRPLSARDVVWALERARGGAARPLFAGWGKPRAQDALTIFIPDAQPDTLADALASPVTAIVPRGFSPEAPDGTGAFRAMRVGGGVTLERNVHAARGAAFLDVLELKKAADLSTSLRSFESGDADVGFLGAGLHRRRAGAIEFRTEPLGSIVLRTGQGAGSWGAPGVASELVAGLDPSRFGRLGLELSSRTAVSDGWGGVPSELVVNADSPYLVEVATVVCGLLSRPGHEIRLRPVPELELRHTVQSGRFSLALDFVRHLGPEPRHVALALLSAADPKLADRPPRVLPSDAQSLTRTLPLAVIGELRLTGAHAAEIHGLNAFDLGSVYRDTR